MPRSPLVNSLIKIREFSLNKLLRTSSSEVLNPIPANGKLYQPGELVVEIKQTLTKFKAEAIDPSGYHVDYAALRQSPAYTDYLESILPKLNTLDVTALREPKTALAFWINLYNALVIHAVISDDVQSSLMEKGMMNFYRFFRQAAYQINGQRFSLEDIEHGVIRANRGVPYMLTPQFPSADMRMMCVLEPLDPRIHFALNCASHSCPPINVYTPDDLDEQLDLAAANFIDNEVQVKDGGLWISMIFKWYQADFGGKAGVLDLIQKYLPANDERTIWLKTQAGKPKIKYSPYNWDLNL